LYFSGRQHKNTANQRSCPTQQANLLTCCHPLELLIAAEQALASRVRCACLSLVRARSLPDQLPKRPVMQSDGITLAFHGETATRLN
jgi:hypothetical protein